ncbi:hypothetical protein C8Q73DRAFT_190189 [Cubamyces lactineus]|nr:hypothetical protein C8Q73DRAFT_190189 [Cubamyces lactineus]
MTMTNKNLPSAFPTEIYEEIISWVDHIQPWSLRYHEQCITAYQLRRSTLYSCSLTCRAWLPTSRTCLYHHLIILSTARIPFERLVQSLDANPWLRALPEIISVIDTHGELATGPQRPESERVGDISHTWPVILASKIPKLPCLRTLRVTLVGGLSRHPQYVRSLRMFNSITALSLAWSFSGSLADLLRLITAFPNLRTLSLLATGWRPRARHNVVLPRQFPQLFHLAVRNPGCLGYDPVWRDVSRILLQAVASSIKILDTPFACIPRYLPSDMPCLQLLYAQDASGYSASRWRNILGRVLSSAPALKHVVIDTGTRVNCLYPINALRENGLKRVADDFLFSLSMTPIITKSAQPLVDDIPRDSGTHALLPDRSYNPIFTPIKVIGTDWAEDLDKKAVVIDLNNHAALEASDLPSEVMYYQLPLVGSHGSQGRSRDHGQMPYPYLR